MEKIKQFVVNIIEKLKQDKKLLWIVCGSAAALLVIIGVVIALLVGGSGEQTPPAVNQMENCTVQVMSEGGMAMEGIGVYVYTDATQVELVTYAKTDAEGVAALDAAVPEGSVAVLDGVPAGYVGQENYPVVEGQTQIVLDIVLLQEMSEITLGGVMFDFTVTATDGTAYTLSELLEQKKAVVLNLWYTHCEPCKAEFPYLQQAYDQYSADVQVLALDPVAEDDEAAVSAFQTENELTLPMAKCDAKWAELVSGIAYPTTIVIDRFGTVALIHVGSIDNVQIFTDAFAFFAAEDYKQTTVANIRDLVVGELVADPGTLDNPLEFKEVEEFEVTVEPGKTVYCNVYDVFGKVLEAESADLQITYQEKIYEPMEDVIKFVVNEPDPEKVKAEATQPTTDATNATQSVDPNAPVPALIAFTNMDDEEATFTVAFKELEGTEEEPLELELGDVTVEMIAGNALGVYYSYVAEEDGDFTITSVDRDNDFEFDFDIEVSNKRSMKTLTLQKDGTEDKEKKATVLTVPVKKDDKLQILVTVEPDEKDEFYPAASIKLNTVIVKEDGEEVTGTGTNTGGSTGGSGDSGSSTDGKLVNPDEPIEIGGTLEFEAEVGVGEMVLFHVYKVSGTTLCLYDADAYVIYNDKTYTPNSNGDIYISVSSESPQVPIVLKIGNSGSSAKTFKINFYYPKGSYMNPYSLEAGEITTEVSKGNEQGVYYTLTASVGGTITIDLLEVTNGVKCDVVLYNERSYKQVALSETEGATSVSIEVRKGDVIQVIINTLPDENFNYPAATIKTKVTLP